MSGAAAPLDNTDNDLPTVERLLRDRLSRRYQGLVLTGGSHTPAARNLTLAAGEPVVQTRDWVADPIEHTMRFSNAEAIAAWLF